MLGELDFYLPKSFCSTNVYGEYTEGKNLIVGLPQTECAVRCGRLKCLSGAPPNSLIKYPQKRVKMEDNYRDRWRWRLLPNFPVIGV